MLWGLFIPILPLWVSAQTDSCDGKDAKGTSLLSLKAETVKALDTSSIFADLVSTFADNETATNNTNASLHRLNQSLEDLVTNVLLSDVNQTAGVPNPEGNYTDPQNRTGLGQLSQTLEFLYLKVAQLETAVELQNIEHQLAKQSFEEELQRLKDQLEHKGAQLQQLQGRLKHHQSQAGHGHKELEGHEPLPSQKHYKTWLSTAKERHAKHQAHMGGKAQEVLREVLLRHHRQSGKDWQPRAPAAAPAARAAAPQTQGEALLQRRATDLDASVSAKGVPIVDDVVDVAEDVGDAVVDGAKAVGEAVTDGTGLVGDALGDAYNEAADKVSFVANTVIDAVEQAVAILTRGFDFSAGCPHWVWPSLGVSESGITIGWGRQMCEVVLVGQRLTLFDFNWGSTTVNYPAPIAAMVALGSNLVNCVSSGGPPFDIFKCVAVSIGETLLQVVPPFSILTQLGRMLSEFLAFFAELASSAIVAAVGETTSLVQDAVQVSFPKRGEAAKLVASRKGLSAHVRRHEHQRKVRKSSMIQTKSEEQPDDTRGSGAIGIATTEAMPYASMLITQFGGDEFDTGSCLGFAPKHRTGPAETVTQRDWQVPSQDSADFVKLEPWAVPCDNQWAKDNPGKWEGYSFYTYESVIEKCVAVSYTMTAQPVIAFVGGLEFDLMPSPLAEISTEVCWPDRVTAPDLSLIVTTIRTAGLVLFKHTIRLHKRFGSDTSFEAGNIKDAIERGRNYFGKGTSADDDKSLQAMSRAALSQVANLSTAEMSSRDRGRQEIRDESKRREATVADFHAESEELYLASARYTTQGVKITQSFAGHEAAHRVGAALRKEVTVLQEDENGTRALGDHELFELGSPAGSLVGFNVKGQLSNAMMQLKVNMKFGPLDSPSKTIDLLNLVDHLRVVLAAIPFVSQASKQKAIDSMTSTNLEAQIPADDVTGTLELQNSWQDYGGKYTPPTYRLKDGVCSIQALIQGGSHSRLIATLPQECRPDQALIFESFTKDGSARVDVREDGGIYWVAGATGHWMSLSNIIFVPGSSGWPVPLANTWAPYPGDFFGTPTYKVKGAICMVDGLITGGSWDHLATLPEECRPVTKQLFNMNNHERCTRVDVHPDGTVEYINGGHSHSWVSLTGIIFTTDAAAQELLPVASGWSVGDGWPGPSYTRAEGLCILEGLAWGNAWGTAIAYLPVECWPMRTLIFGTNNGWGVIQRVDVDTDGTVKHVNSRVSPASSWLSLAGIAFTQETSGVRLLPLRSGWEAWGEGYGAATFNMKNGLCMLEALILNGNDWSDVARLPEGCRPTKRLIFSGNAHAGQYRVDVDTDGVVKLVRSSSNAAYYLSLSNIAFAPGTMGHIALPLLGGWGPYGGGYGSPDYTLRNGLCSLEGLVHGGGRGTQVATLPEDCRPSGVLIFQTDNNGETARVDVSPTGVVSWVDGGSQSWLSLSGIVFAPAGGAVSYPIPLENGWVNYRRGFAEARYSVIDGICSIEGLITGGTWSTFATLPSDCRPSKVLIFNMNQKEFNMRVDVNPQGQIYCSGDGLGIGSHAWISLSGIHFEAV